MRLPLSRFLKFTLLIMILSLTGCVAEKPVSSLNQKLVLTSISPLADLIKQVGGEKVQVVNLVPPGTDPHDFEPKPDVVRQVATARLFIANGVGQEYYLDKLIQNAGNPSLRTVVLSDGLPILGQEKSTQGNPHLWLDVQNTQSYVEKIRDTLIESYPEDKDTFEKNALSFLKELKTLDQWISDQIQTLPADSRKIIVFHDAWSYYANRYGLEILTPVVHNGEAEPSAKEYAEIIQLIQKHKVKAIFGEVGFNSKLIHQLANDSGVKVVDDLYDDTLGETSETDSYIKVMQYNTKALVSALQ
jgi:manganese/iron transport system substrate-binding protein